MDFIQTVKSVQEQKNISDKEVCDRAGIGEYVFYNLMNYRTYLTRVAYFSLSCVLGLKILSDIEIDELLEDNKSIVGSPESNLYVAAECADFDRVEVLEKELALLKNNATGIDAKNKVINGLFVDIDKLKKELKTVKDESELKIQDAYSKGIKDGSSKVVNMQSAQSQMMIDALNEEYMERIGKLETALKKSEYTLSVLYKEIEAINQDGIVEIDLSNTYKPMVLQKEELGLNLDNSLISDVLNSYYEGNKSVDNISEELGLTDEEIKGIIKQYTIIDRNGVKSYVKKK